jgi:hypothetical protein
MTGSAPQPASAGPPPPAPSAAPVSGAAILLGALGDRVKRQPVRSGVVATVLSLLLLLLVHRRRR